MSPELEQDGWDEVGGTGGQLPIGRMAVRFEGITKNKEGLIFHVHKDGVGAINTRLVRVADPADSGVYNFRLNFENAWKFLRAAESMGVSKDDLKRAMPLAKGTDKKAALNHAHVEAVFALFAGKTGYVKVTPDGQYTHPEWIKPFAGPDVIEEPVTAVAKDDIPF